MALIPRLLIPVTVTVKKAFLAAWQAACSDGRGEPVMAIPGERVFLLSQVSFQGPCKSPITVKVTRPWHFESVPEILHEARHLNL